ncbi:MAG: hypothetical protein MK008_01700 [Bdellovibrionales bacterium]|nr:hypothetical protein [Bdellovibrionales bacterium]
MYLIGFLLILIFNIPALGADFCRTNFEPQYKYYKVNPNTVSTHFTKSDYQIHEKIGSHYFSVIAHLTTQGYIHFKMILRHETSPMRSPNLPSGQKQFDAIMDYFSHISKSTHAPINGVYGEWTPAKKGELSDNYNMFFRALNDYMKRFSLSKEEAAQLAAFDTWSGKQAQRYGFDKVNILKLEPDYIKVLYSR